MALIPIRPSQVALEYTSVSEVDMDTDVLLLGSNANSGQLVQMTPRLFADAIVSSTTGPQESFTASDTLTTGESGKWCDNTGASTAVMLTAPASPTIGDKYTLERVAAYAFRFKPGSGHTVNGGTVNKYVELTATGVLTFEYRRAGEWVITNDSALWNFEP